MSCLVPGCCQLLNCLLLRDLANKVHGVFVVRLVGSRLENGRMEKCKDVSVCVSGSKVRK